MGPEVPLRVAGPGDVQEVVRLMAAFRDHLEDEEPSDATIRSVVERLIGDPGAEFLLGGEPPLGIVQMRYRLSVWTGAEDAWLEDAFVLAEARGEGLGTRLVEAAIHRARSRGCARIQLDANEANTGAVRLYESLGFSRFHRPANFGEAPDHLFTLELG